MLCKDQPRSIRGLRSVNSPGGISKHYRIQFRDQETSVWRMYANFRFMGEAEACLDALAARGIEARLVCADLCPTAY